MIDTTQADYNQLETIAGKFGQLADSNTALHSRLAQTSQQLKGGGWAGAGAVAFLNEMEGEIFPALQRLTQALEQAQTTTRQSSETIRAAEEEAAGLFGGDSSLGREGSPATNGASHEITPPRIYIINGINSAGNVEGRIGDNDSVALEDLLEKHGYDPDEVISTSAIFLQPKQTNFKGTDLGGLFSPLDWFTGGLASNIDRVTNTGAAAINYLTGSSVYSSVHGIAEVYEEYMDGERGIYTQKVYSEIAADLRNNPLAPGQTVMIMGHSGGGQVGSNVVGMLERNLDVDVSGLVTMGSPVSNYDEAGRYAETIADVMHHQDRVGALVGTPLIRSDEARYFAPAALKQIFTNPGSVFSPYVNPIAGFFAAELPARYIGDTPNVEAVNLARSPETSNAHSSYMHDPGVSRDMLHRLNRIYPELNLSLPSGL